MRYYVYVIRYTLFGIRYTLYHSIALGCGHIEVEICGIRLRSHRNIRYTVYGIRYTLFGIQYTLYGHGGSHRSSTCCQCALFVSMKKVAKSVFCIFMRIQMYASIVQKLFLT